MSKKKKAEEARIRAEGDKAKRKDERTKSTGRVDQAVRHLQSAKH